LVFVSSLPNELDNSSIESALTEAVGEVTAEDLAQMASGQVPAPAIEPSGKVRGRIVAVRGDDVFVDLGGKSEGVIPLSEFEQGPPNIGDEMEFSVAGVDADSSVTKLTRKALRVQGDVRQLKVGDVVQAKVTGTNIGGLELRLGRARGFMPASQIDIARREDFKGLIGQWLDCEVTEVDRKNRSLVLSRRRVLERERDAAKQQVMSALKEGEMRRGVVRRLLDFGAIVDIGGVEGLLHISEMSYGRLGHPSEMLHTDQEVDVVVMKIKGSDRISLGMKQLAPDPWTLAPSNYRVGDVVDAKIMKLMEFGAFAELEPGVEGLIPISEMSWTQRVMHPSKILSVGDRVRCSILAMDPVKRKISMSLKALSSDPWIGIEERYQPEIMVSGAVTRLETFGAFIKLEEGVDGLIHISQLSDQRVRAVEDVLRVGDVVQVRVINVDPQQRRIGLSMRNPQPLQPIEEPPMPDMPSHKPDRKRKRPLRGGYDW
jgi:small subunit ribosomal protein S1